MEDSSRIRRYAAEATGSGNGLDLCIWTGVETSMSLLSMASEAMDVSGIYGTDRSYPLMYEYFSTD